jgi:hypothetical protein
MENLFPAAPTEASMDLAASITNSAVDITEAGGGGDVTYVVYQAERGEWLAGRAKDLVNGQRACFNLNSMHHGWILWHQGKPTKAMTHHSQAMPQAMAPIGKDEPAEARSLRGVFLDMADEPIQMQFDTNSLGGRRLVADLMVATRARIASGEREYLHPVGILEALPFYQSKHGKKYSNPDFKITGWANSAGDIRQVGEAEPEKIEQATEEVAEPARKGRVNRAK